MIEIRKTELFAQWLDGLRDLQARARVQARIERLAQGNAGDVQPVGGGVSELRIMRPRLPGLFQAARARGGCSFGRWGQTHPSQGY